MYVHVSFIGENRITDYSEILFHHSFCGFGNIAYRVQGGREGVRVVERIPSQGGLIYVE